MDRERVRADFARHTVPLARCETCFPICYGTHFGGRLSRGPNGAGAASGGPEYFCQALCSCRRDTRRNPFSADRRSTDCCGTDLIGTLPGNYRHLPVRMEVCPG